MKNKTIIAAAALIFLAASCNPVTKDSTQPRLMIGEHSINVEVSDTPQEQQQGLSGRPSLAENDGMLFVFDSPGRPAFWMKGMQFDLDFIWIKDGKVIEITSNVKAQPGVPDAQLASYQPREAVDSMLEVNAGWAERHGIPVGDRVDGQY